VQAGEAKLPGREGVIFLSLALQKSKFRRGCLFVFGLILCAGALVLSVFWCLLLTHFACLGLLLPLGGF